jgi:hypothetical protein
MAWQCRLVDGDPGADRKPGDMWFVPSMVEEYAEMYTAHYLSQEYMRDWFGKRAPLVVVLPDGTPWCMDHRYGQHNGKKGPQPGWTITGEAPNVTASPSINFEGTYHGWLQGGTLSDDVEGRVFP